MSQLRILRHSVQKAEQNERRQKILRRIGISAMAVLIPIGFLAFIGIGAAFG